MFSLPLFGKSSSCVDAHAVGDIYASETDSPLSSSTSWKDNRRPVDARKLEILKDFNDVLLAVQAPPGEPINDWYTIGAFISNNIDLKPGEGFPPNVEYRWSEGKGKAVPLRCSGIEYMHHCIKWLEGQVCDHTLFPLSDATPYPRHLKAIVEAMLVKIFRILAIARSAFFKDITRAGADRKFERLFKTFLYFCWEHHLMNPRELKAIESEVEIVRELYDRDCEARGTYHK